MKDGKIGGGIMPRRVRLKGEGTVHYVIIPRGAILKVRSNLAGNQVQEFGIPLAEISRQLGVSTSSTLSTPSLGYT